MTDDEVEALRQHVGLSVFEMKQAVKIATDDSPEHRLIAVARLMKEQRELRERLKATRH